MTTGGWITLVLSVGGVTGFFVWCVWLVLRRHRPDHTLAHLEPVHEDETDRR